MVSTLGKLLYKSTPLLFFGVILFSPLFVQAQSTPLLSVTILDQNNKEAESPEVFFSPIAYAARDQITSGVLGTDDQFLYLSIDNSADNWTLNLAAEQGPEAQWKSELYSYDYNHNEIDSDKVLGQLTISPENSLIESTDCDQNSIELGNEYYFSESIIDSILLASSSQVDASCQIALKSIELSQLIPSKQPAGEYFLKMTISLIST